LSKDEDGALGFHWRPGHRAASRCIKNDPAP